VHLRGFEKYVLSGSIVCVWSHVDFYEDIPTIF
jgi:hypothetical protein